MNKLKFPAELPGAFCVIVRDDDRYLLVLDDPDNSNFELGSDILRIMDVLRTYKKDKLLFDALDAAREFGVAQAVFETGVIYRIKEPLPKQGIDFSEFFNAGDEEAYSITPPPL